MLRVTVQSLFYLYLQYTGNTGLQEIKQQRYNLACIRGNIRVAVTPG